MDDNPYKSPQFVGRAEPNPGTWHPLTWAVVGFAGGTGLMAPLFLSVDDLGPGLRNETPMVSSEPTMSDQPVTPKPFQFSVRKLLVFVGVLCVVFALIAVVLSTIRATIDAGKRNTCGNNLKVIGMALHDYHNVYGCFPAPFSVDASGKPLHSWRVAIEPFRGAVSTFQSTFDFTLPWNHPKNLKVSTPFADYGFTCPGTPPGSGFTNYVMVVGKKRRATSGQTKDHPDAIIVVEIADSDIHWTEPRDLNFDEMSFTINDKAKPSISSHHPPGALVLYANGHVRWLDESTDPDELRKLLTENFENASGRKNQP